MHQSNKTRRGRGATRRDDRAPFPAVAPVNPKMFGNDLSAPKYPMPTSNLVIAPRLRPLVERPRLLRRCGLFATGRGERGRADSRRDVNIETTRVRTRMAPNGTPD